MAAVAGRQSSTYVSFYSSPLSRSEIDCLLNELIYRYDLQADLDDFMARADRDARLLRLLLLAGEERELLRSTPFMSYLSSALSSKTLA